jgi:hypothetical protein
MVNWQLSIVNSLDGVAVGAWSMGSSKSLWPKAGATVGGGATGTAVLLVQAVNKNRKATKVVTTNQFFISVKIHFPS